MALAGREALNVAFYPNSSAWDGNPYYPRLRQALQARGVCFADPRNDYLSKDWLLAQHRAVQVLHFHWIQYHYASSYDAAWLALGKFIGKLALARRLGYRLVWTMHNSAPHEPMAWPFDALAYRAMAALAHSVIILCEAGRQELARRYGRRRQVHTAPHGDFIDTYPNTLTRREAREKLGIDRDCFVYLSFGSIRPYKGAEELIATFRQLPEGQLRLLIAGRPHTQAIEQRIRELAAPDPRIMLVLAFIASDQLQLYFNAADVIVTPFARVLSSSSAMTALSFGRPLIAPALGCLPEWVTEACTILYDAGDPAGLGRAMQAARGRDLVAMGHAACQCARRFDWKEIAGRTIAAYEGNEQ